MMCPKGKGKQSFDHRSGRSLTICIHNNYLPTPREEVMYSYDDPYFPKSK